MNILFGGYGDILSACAGILFVHDYILAVHAKNFLKNEEKNIYVDSCCSKVFNNTQNN